MSKSNVFISYRRTDARNAVRGLYFQLRLRFGSGQVFMDVSSIKPGDVWPERLKRAVNKSTVVLVVVGPDWLKSADQFGRRRLDSPDDWVRIEIEAALDEGKNVIPLLIGGEQELPPVEALPPSLTRLHQHQHFVLSDNNWEGEVSNLASMLIDCHGLRPLDQDVVFPIPEVKVPPLTEDELDQALLALPGWEPVESAIPRDYPRTRQELRRGYRFDKFKSAIEFLQSLVAPLNELKHHPRIENQWRTVFIHFTTWDIGNKISRLDVKAAAVVDQLYEQRKREVGTSAGPAP